MLTKRPFSIVCMKLIVFLSFSLCILDVYLFCSYVFDQLEKKRKQCTKQNSHRSDGMSFEKIFALVIFTFYKFSENFRYFLNCLPMCHQELSGQYNTKKAKFDFMLVARVHNFPHFAIHRKQFIVCKRICTHRFSPHNILPFLSARSFSSFKITSEEKWFKFAIMM